MTTDTAPTPHRSRATILQCLTIAHGLLEGGVSLIASSMAGSVALMSFGLDSMVEVLSASIVLWRVATMSRRGLFRISERGGLQMVGVCFIVLAIAVTLDGVRTLVAHERPHESPLGIAVAVFSMVAMPLLARAKRKSSGEIESVAMRADARQTDFCAWLATILLAGLLLYKALGWWWADPVAAIVMCPIIFWEGIQAVRGFSCGCAVCS